MWTLISYMHISIAIKHNSQALVRYKFSSFCTHTEPCTYVFLWIDGIPYCPHPEEVRQHLVLLERLSPFKYKCDTGSKSSIRLSTAFVLIFWGMKMHQPTSPSDHHGPWSAPHWVHLSSAYFCIWVWTSRALQQLLWRGKVKERK